MTTTRTLNQITSVNLGKDLTARLRDKAAQQNRTIASVLRELVEEWVSE